MNEAQYQESADNRCSAANLLAELIRPLPRTFAGRGDSESGVQLDPVSCRAQDTGHHKLPTNIRQGYLQLYRHQSTGWLLEPSWEFGCSEDSKRFRAWMILGAHEGGTRAGPVRQAREQWPRSAQRSSNHCLLKSELGNVGSGGQCGSL